VSPQWNQEKASDKFVIPIYNTNLNTLLTSFLICKKRKPRENTMKNWFPKEPSTLSLDAPDAAASPPPVFAAFSPEPDAAAPSPAPDVAAPQALDVVATPPALDVLTTPSTLDVVAAPPILEYSPHGVASSPPRHQKRVVRKLTLKKKIA
jgi:hypothetical protein